MAAVTKNRNEYIKKNKKKHWAIFNLTWLEGYIESQTSIQNRMYIW
jgi:hypothetical protein